MQTSAPDSSSIDIRRAGDDERSILEAMMTSYQKVFGSESAYPGLKAYWSENTRYPYFLLRDTKVIGFALVQEVKPSLFELVEFYVVENMQSKGYGRFAAAAVFAAHAGRWRVGVRKDNIRGFAFWRSFFASHIGVQVLQHAEPPALIYEFSPQGEA
jgi:predicted acetyltransferase